jgi:hypothetical protein
MLRLLEPHKQEVERFRPFPGHALGNGRPRSVHLTAERAAQKRASQDAAVTHAAAQHNARRPACALAAGGRPSAQGAATPHAHKNASARARSEKAQSTLTRALLNKPPRPAGKTLAQLMEGADAETVSEAPLNCSPAPDPESGATGGAEDDEANRVPGLELTGLTAEDLDDAGILYDEERGLLGPAVAAPEAARGTSARKTVRASHGVSIKQEQREDYGDEDEAAGKAGPSQEAAQGPAARQSVKINTSASGSASGKLQRPSTAPNPVAPEKPKARHLQQM